MERFQERYDSNIGAVKIQFLALVLKTDLLCIQIILKFLLRKVGIFKQPSKICLAAYLFLPRITV